MELMVVVAVVAIIASVAVPSYRSYLRRAQRADATAALLQIRQAQEKFFLQNGQYADTAQLDTAPPGASASAPARTRLLHDRASSDAHDLYGDGHTATGGQADDTPCGSFTINEMGVRGSSPGAITTCWK
jgi:type IV pilus assembly protein PilE